MIVHLYPDESFIVICFKANALGHLYFILTVLGYQLKNNFMNFHELMLCTGLFSVEFSETEQAHWGCHSVDITSLKWRLLAAGQ